ncbi:MAG: response regulator transcription factor [Coriobacteriia bacterium]
MAFISKGREILTRALLVLSISFGFASMYFFQYPAIGTGTTNLAVTLCSVAVFLLVALVAYRWPVDYDRLFIVLLLVLLARYIVPALLHDGAGIALMPTAILAALMPLMASVIVVHEKVKDAVGGILVGFALSLLLVVLVNQAELMDPVRAQGISNGAFALFMALFLFLKGKTPITSPSGSMIREKVKGIEAPGGSRIFILTVMGLLLFGFGAFEAYASFDLRFLMNSNFAMFFLAGIFLLTLLLYWKRPITLWNRGVQLVVILSLVYLCVIFIALMSNDFSNTLLLLMSGAIVILHAFIWASVTEMFRDGPVLFIFSLVFVSTMIVHRAGWLLTGVLSLMFGGRDQLLLRISIFVVFASIIVVLLLCAVVFLYILPRRKQASIMLEGKERESTSSSSIEDYSREHGLTERETEILMLYYQGRSASYISEKFCLSEATVKTHIRHIYTKLDIHGKQELLDRLSSVQ